MTFDYRNIDCMVEMKEFPDKFFDLAIVDPPYGIGASNYSRGGTQYGNSDAICKSYDIKEWDNEKPSPEYFNELFRVSKNQIIWGANHFISRIPIDSSGWIVWDKMTAPGSGYADCELAWTSFEKVVRQIKIQWSGMLQYDMKKKEDRIHPTQKPIPLYKWILKNFAKPGDKILDTHVGSASSIIAAIDFGFEITGFELDKDYFDSSMKRINRFLSQTKIEFVHG